MLRLPSEAGQSITHQAHRCIVTFASAISSLQGSDQQTQQELPPTTLEDELGRFHIWSGNTGAHGVGKVSLDHKLREASHIKERVLQLLQSLTEGLEESMKIIDGDRKPWEDFSDSGSDCSDNDDENTLVVIDSASELVQLASHISEIITCLMRLSVSFRNPAPHDQFRESRTIDISHHEEFDVGHVRDKFPLAEQYLVVRLGQAISRRRQYLKYREEHRARLASGVDLTEIRLDGEEGTVISSIPSDLKSKFGGKRLEESVMFQDTISETSFASSASGRAKLRPPPLPEQGQDEKPFDCPLCHRFICVDQSSAWFKHVYEDLQPYVGNLISTYRLGLTSPSYVPSATAVHQIAPMNHDTNGSTMRCESIGDRGNAPGNVAMRTSRSRSSERM
jgi:hypothetical protein